MSSFFGNDATLLTATLLNMNDFTGIFLVLLFLLRFRKSYFQGTVYSDYFRTVTANT